MNTPSSVDRISLPFKAVKIQCLDEHGKDINCVASGFICNEGGVYFLYTCWHVVTGYDMHDIRIGNKLPSRRALRVMMQQCGNASELHNGKIVNFPAVKSYGGVQEIIVPLYHSQELPLQPAWYQFGMHEPNEDLNNVGIRVPVVSDIVKIPLPVGLSFDPMQVVDNSVDSIVSTLPGDQVFIVGYPYGYSTTGIRQPTPVVLVRHVAASSVDGRGIESLLDGAAAGGMSGGPIFKIQEGKFRITGVYTGMIYPDYALQKNDRITALGTFCPIFPSCTTMPLEEY